MGHLDLAIILLAAGASSRMRGRDKLLEVVEGCPLIRRQAEIARSITTGPLIVALPPAPHPRHAALDGVDVTPLAVPDAAMGMSASLRRAVAGLPQHCKAAMILLADLPELTADDLRKVAQSVDLNTEMQVWRGATQDGKPGHPIVFHAALFEALKVLHGDEGARAVVAAAGDKVQLVPLPGNRARLDLDTPEDWADWRAKNPS